MNEPSSGPIVRIVDPPRRRRARRRDWRRGAARASANATIGRVDGERHDDDDEQRLGVVDGVVEVVRGGVPAGVQRSSRPAARPPTGRTPLRLRPGSAAAPRRRSGVGGRPAARACCVVPVLHAMGERREPRGREGVQDREREDGRGDRRQRIRLDAKLQRTEHAAVRGDGVGAERCGKH